MKKALVFLLIFSIGSVLFAQQGYELDGLEYEVVDVRSVIITGYTGNATTLNIPAQIKDLPVTAIGYEAFRYCESLTSVTIPSSVTKIGFYAFFDCSSLTSVTVDNRNPSYASIDGVLFDKSMQTIISYPAGKTARTYTIPSSVTDIGEGAFFGCSSLTSITIPSSVTLIREGAFYLCISLTSVTIPSSVTYIGEGAFYYCSSLISVTIPSSVTEIGGGTFAGCNSLTSVTISSSVTSIGESAFVGCESLTSISIPSSVTEIGEYAFGDCSSLTSVTLSRRTQVGERAFPPNARITYSD